MLFFVVLIAVDAFDMAFGGDQRAALDPKHGGQSKPTERLENMATPTPVAAPILLTERTEDQNGSRVGGKTELVTKCASRTHTAP
jgi:hypothetical protein